jgi:hypothetical protein
VEERRGVDVERRMRLARLFQRTPLVNQEKSAFTWG